MGNIHSLSCSLSDCLSLLRVSSSCPPLVWEQVRTAMEGGLSVREIIRVPRVGGAGARCGVYPGGRGGPRRRKPPRVSCLFTLLFLL